MTFIVILILMKIDVKKKGRAWLLINYKSFISTRRLLLTKVKIRITIR
jgi:hypothetical protein